MDHFTNTNQNIQWDNFFKNYVNNKNIGGLKSSKVAPHSQQVVKKENGFKKINKSSSTAMKRVGEIIIKKKLKGRNCPIKRPGKAQKSQSAKKRQPTNKVVNNTKKNGRQRRVVNKISNFLP